jgi:hypothetical protein
MGQGLRKENVFMFVKKNVTNSLMFVFNLKEKTRKISPAYSNNEIFSLSEIINVDIHQVRLGSC